MAELWFYLVNLFYVSSAALAGFLIARAGDRILGIDFKTDVLGTINGDPTAAGIYYGLRWFGICWLVSQAIS